MFVTKKKYCQMKQELTAELMKSSYAEGVLKAALEDIIAQNTKKPNATVSRMIEIAERALEETKE